MPTGHLDQATRRRSPSANPPAPKGAAKIVNLTGHRVVVWHAGRVVATLLPEPGARPFRLADRYIGDDFTLGRVPVAAVAPEPPPLPPPAPGVWYLVSQVAAHALAARGIRRPDVLYPGPGVSDRGRTVGCRGLRWLITAR